MAPASSFARSVSSIANSPAMAPSGSTSDARASMIRALGSAVAEHVCSRNSAAETASRSVAFSVERRARAMNPTASFRVPFRASVSRFASFRHAALSTLSGPVRLWAPSSSSSRDSLSRCKPRPDRRKTLHCSLTSTSASSRA